MLARCFALLPDATSGSISRSKRLPAASWMNASLLIVNRVPPPSVTEVVSFGSVVGIDIEPVIGPVTRLIARGLPALAAWIVARTGLSCRVGGDGINAVAT